MRKLTKYIAALAMAVAVAVTAITPVTVEAKPVYPEKLTLYHSSANKDIKAKSTQKNQKFTFEGNKNWKITSVEISKYEKVGKNSYYSSTYTQRWSYSSSPKRKVSCGVGNIEKGKYYQVNVSMTNTKTGGSMIANFYINYPYNY